MRRKDIPFFVVAIAAVSLALSCSTQTKQLPTTRPPASEQVVPGIGATPGVIPPAGQAPPSAGAPEEMKLQDYQGQVKKSWTEGSVQFDGIVSNFPCAADSDCTSTKYYNAPAKEDGCTCAAPCTPYVVTVAEKNRREETNKRLCDNNDWYGPNCSAPDCGFIEFEKFRCTQGKCAGLAMGKAQGQ